MVDSETFGVVGWFEYGLVVERYEDPLVETEGVFLFAGTLEDFRVNDGELFLTVEVLVTPVLDLLLGFTWLMRVRRAELGAAREEVLGCTCCTLCLELEEDLLLPSRLWASADRAKQPAARIRKRKRIVLRYMIKSSNNGRRVEPAHRSPNLMDRGHRWVLV